MEKRRKRVSAYLPDTVTSGVAEATPPIDSTPLPAKPASAGASLGDKIRIVPSPESKASSQPKKNSTEEAQILTLHWDPSQSGPMPIHEIPQTVRALRQAYARFVVVEPGESSKLAAIRDQEIAEFDQVIAGLPDPDDLSAAVAALQSTPAGWAARCGRPRMLLTPFQTHQLLAGFGYRLRLEHYVLLECLGKGGMGEVFAVRNTKLSRIEAIKTLRTDCAGNYSRGKAKELQRRFQREVDSLVNLEHPNITRIFYAGHAHANEFIAMEFVCGDNLEKKIQRCNRAQEPMPIREGVGYILDIARALDYAHGKRLVHRDVKPNNIMVTEYGTAKLLDLGIARSLDVSLDAHGDGSSCGPLTATNGNFLGTPDFLPPEQWQNARTASEKTDQYALGATLFYVLAGDTPFHGRTPFEYMHKHCVEKRPSLRKRRRDVPSRLDAVVRKMMAIEPEDRYGSMAQVIDELERFVDEGINWPKIHRFAALATVLTVVLLGIFFGMRGSLTGATPASPLGLVDAPAVPLSAKELAEAGMHARGSENYPLAIEYFRQALRLDPTNADYAMTLASLYLKLGDYPAAIENFSQVLAQHPDDMFAHYYRGFAKERTGDLPGAIADYEAASLKDPRSQHFKEALARVRKVSHSASN